MPSIKSQIDAILRRKDNKLAVIADEIAEEVKKELREVVYNEWFASFTPTVYERTGEVIDSITAEVKKDGRCNYTVRVFFDYDKIRPHYLDGSWNAHAGFDGVKFAEGLIASMDKGMGGSPNNPRYGEAAMFIDAVQQYAGNLAKKLLKQKL